MEGRGTETGRCNDTHTHTDRRSQRRHHLLSVLVAQHVDDIGPVPQPDQQGNKEERELGGNRGLESERELGEREEGRERWRVRERGLLSEREDWRVREETE